MGRAWSSRHGKVGIGVSLIAAGAILVVLELSLASSAANATSPTATQLTPLTTLNSFYSPYTSTTFQMSTGSDCGWEGNAPAASTSGSNSVSISAALNPNPHSGGCSPMWMFGSSDAGWHVYGPSGAYYFTPSQTRFYNMSASWSVTINLYVAAACGSASNGVSLPDYAEVNITPTVALFNVNLNDGQTLPSAQVLNYIHGDTRDLACSSGVINFDQTWSQTITMTAQAWLSSSYSYAPRASMSASTFVVSTDSQYAAGTYSVSGTLNSVTLT